MTPEKIAEIDEYRKTMNVHDAARKAGTTQATYYAWKAKMKPKRKYKKPAKQAKPKTKPYVEEIVVPKEAYETPKKVVAIVGDPEAVGKFIGDFLHGK